MKTTRILGAFVMSALCFYQCFAQNNIDAKKVFEQNLKNSLIQDAINVVTGNEVKNDYSNVNNFLPGGGISGSMFLGNGTMTDFVGVQYIGLNSADQSPSINGKPVAWIFDNYSWRSVPLSDLAMIAYNNLEYITARNYRLSVSVSLKDGSKYDYTINPARNIITVLVKAGGNNAREQQVQVFDPSYLYVKNIIFY